jgi:hypothetical protein
MVSMRRPGVPDAILTALSDGRASLVPALRAITMKSPPSGPSVVHLFSPLTLNPSPSGVSVVLIARGKFPSASVTHSAAITSSGIVGSRARNAAW